MDLEKIVREEVKELLKEELFKKEEKVEETPVVEEPKTEEVTPVEAAAEQPTDPMNPIM